MVVSARILDAWYEPRRRHRIVLYALAPPFADRGFVARATDDTGHQVLERYFVETYEGLEAVDADGARARLADNDTAARPRGLGRLLKTLA